MSGGVKAPPPSPLPQGEVNSEPPGEERVREATLTLQGRRRPPSPGSLAALASPTSPCGRGDQRQRFARVRQTSRKLELKLMRLPSGIAVLVERRCAGILLHRRAARPIPCRDLQEKAREHRVEGEGQRAVLIVWHRELFAAVPKRAGPAWRPSPARQGLGPAMKLLDSRCRREDATGERAAPGRVRPRRSLPRPEPPVILRSRSTRVDRARGAQASP